MNPPASAAQSVHPQGRRNRALIAAEQPTAAAVSVAGDKPIAVLPFVDMSETNGQEYIADGAVEAVLCSG